MVPKLVLHSLLASHRDTTLIHGNPGDFLLKSRGFNCDCSSLVVDLPFLYQSSEFEQAPLIHFIAVENIFCTSPVIKLSYARESRGPPAFQPSI